MADANIQLCRKAPRQHCEYQPLCKSSVLASLDWLSPRFRLTHLAKFSLARSAIPESLPHVSQSQLSALFASWRLLAVAKQRYSTNPESGLSDYLRHPNSCKPTAKIHQHTPQITPKQLYAKVRLVILIVRKRPVTNHGHTTPTFPSSTFLFFHPSFGWFHTGFGWFHPGFGWFHPRFGWFHPGFWVVSSWFRVVSWFGVFVPQIPTHRQTVILSTQTTFICHPLTSRPTQDQGICNLAICNNTETLTQMG